jgi:hypothetical protein
VFEEIFSGLNEINPFFSSEKQQPIS